jgi:hypothetical protein
MVIPGVGAETPEVSALRKKAFRKGPFLLDFPRSHGSQFLPCHLLRKFHSHPFLHVFAASGHFHLRWVVAEIVVPFEQPLLALHHPRLLRCVTLQDPLLSELQPFSLLISGLRKGTNGVQAVFEELRHETIPWPRMSFLAAALPAALGGCTHSISQEMRATADEKPTYPVVSAHPQSYMRKRSSGAGWCFS